MSAESSTSTSITLSSLDSEEAFALFGPGFSSSGRWTLLRSLGAPDRTPARVVFARYEDHGRDATVLGGLVEEFDELDLDVPAADLRPELEETGHAQAVQAIRDAIAAGDLYQANFTVRARFACSSSASLLATLCRTAVPRFAAWVRFPDGSEIVSASPELFFGVQGRRIRVEPMKGTALPDAEGRLDTSEKDRAELAMITDLLRNDLTAICVPRTVRCVNERRFIRLPYAIQTVSDVEGELPEDVRVLDALDSLHPGGSITGAPKIAAMDLIRELESSPRGAYCGSLGLWRGDTATFSILIRTAERPAGETLWRYGVGGGIVWDSDPAEELEEARIKLGALGWRTRP